MKYRIALVGFGFVGRGLAEILRNKNAYLMERYSCQFDIVAISTRSGGVAYNPEGLDIPVLTQDAEARRPFSRDAVDWDTLTMIEASNADIVCQLANTDLETGEPAISHCKAAIRSGKHVVTSNKGPAALSYRELAALAKKKGVQFLIEGTVMAGTPVLNLSGGPLAGCRIQAARGILNGTTNYILTEMENGMTYESALTKAQELGYAEADPTGDVEGFDARGKVAILANVVMDTAVKIEDVSCKGITGITPEDIKTAREKKCRWKLIGTVKKENGTITASVAPQMLPQSHPLAGVMGATNAVTFSTDLMGDISIIGAGAGGMETGFAILADLLAVHYNQRS